MWAASSLRSNGQIVQLSRKDFFLFVRRTILDARVQYSVSAPSALTLRAVLLFIPGICRVPQKLP